MKNSGFVRRPGPTPTLGRAERTPELGRNVVLRLTAGDWK